VTSTNNGFEKAAADIAITTTIKGLYVSEEVFGETIFQC
jgi:hypothetical protein